MRQPRIRMLTSAAIVVPDDLPGLRVPVIFDYDPADPLAVTVAPWMDQGRVKWVIARDLLRDGLSVPSGVGDVTAWPGTDDPHRCYLRFKSQARLTVLSFDIHELRAFLGHTYDSIPVGTELRAADVDAALNAILGEAV